jgi:hypothetical protein
MKSLPTPHYTEKIWCHFSLPPLPLLQLLAPNLPAHQLTEWTGEHQYPSTMWESPIHPWDHKPVQPLGRLTPPTKLNNKQ